MIILSISQTSAEKFRFENLENISLILAHFPPTVTEYQYNCWKLAQSFLYIVAFKHSIIRQEINTFFLDSNQNPALVITPIK